MSFTIKDEINYNGINKKVKNRMRKTQPALDMQIIKDSNYYAPLDNGTLQDSALVASKIGEGIIIWDTPYAKRLYYGVSFNFNKSKNPNATAKWFEVAKANNKEKWEKIANDEYNK